MAGSAHRHLDMIAGAKRLDANTAIDLPGLRVYRQPQCALVGQQIIKLFRW